MTDEEYIRDLCDETISHVLKRLDAISGVVDSAHGIDWPNGSFNVLDRLAEITKSYEGIVADLIEQAKEPIKVSEARQARFKIAPLRFTHVLVADGRPANSVRLAIRKWCNDHLGPEQYCWLLVIDEGTFEVHFTDQRYMTLFLLHWQGVDLKAEITP